MGLSGPYSIGLGCFMINSCRGLIIHMLVFFFFFIFFFMFRLQSRIFF
jgi:hypothetical protein